MTEWQRGKKIEERNERGRSPSLSPMLSTCFESGLFWMLPAMPTSVRESLHGNTSSPLLTES